MISQLRQAMNQAKKDFPNCKIHGPVRFDDCDLNVYYVRDNEGNLLRELDVYDDVI